jgi:hypothetical protein
MKEKKDKTKFVMGVLISIIIILLVVIAYVFIGKPVINGLVIQGYNQGAQDVIVQIVQQAGTCQQVPLRIGNQTMNIVAVECLQPLQ